MKQEITQEQFKSQPPDSAHYRNLKIEPIRYIEENALGFHEGNIIKYVSRWRYKDGISDLEKARFYIDRLIELEQQAQEIRANLEEGNNS